MSQNRSMGGASVVRFLSLLPPCVARRPHLDFGHLQIVGVAALQQVAGPGSYGAGPHVLKLRREIAWG
jgi:hypothetical protein